MGKINSKQKGKNGELEIVHILKDNGFSARRTAQYCGKSGEASDVVCDELSDFHIEVKRNEHLNIYEAVAQSIRDSKDNNKVPVVFHRKNNKQWLCTLNLDDFIKLIKEKGI